MTTNPDRLKELESLVRTLRTDVLNSALKVHELEFHLRRQDERLEAIMSKLFEWCAPQSLKDAILKDLMSERIDAPSDVIGALDEWMKRND
ncbi:hypothetical protein N7I30_13895 [Aurantimonas litoralis]|nr:hypothetical protein [Aurantimonas litoralis]